MENFVKRLIKEHKDLTEKRKALEDVIFRKLPNKLNKRELLLLGGQSVVMDTYINILENRLIEHDIEAKDGLYKKIITQYDIIKDEDEDSKDNDETPRPSDCDMYAGRKSNVEDIKYE